MFRLGGYQTTVFSVMALIHSVMIKTFITRQRTPLSHLRGYLAFLFSEIIMKMDFHPFIRSYLKVSLNHCCPKMPIIESKVMTLNSQKLKDVQITIIEA